MIFSLSSDDFSENQIQILKLLFDKDYLQQELQNALSTTGSNLHYHLNRLKKYNLIRKEIVQKIGNARINRISLNPSARQYIRKILRFKVKDYTLITGFGTLGTGYKLPDTVFQILREIYYPISRIVCFTSPDAIEKREEHQEQENLRKFDHFIEFPYEDYRNIESEFFQKVENILSVEMKSADIIIDLTPLSKLFSFKLLEMANKYYLPCVYLGINEEGNYELLSMSNMKIEGIIQPFK
ncbi:MAG: winged helix-turn-helix domain-containing protein [Candidatus Lokiarchaeia archaeon]